MKNIIIGVSAGIACYKVIDLVKGLKEFNLDIIMTKNSLNLISKKEFEKIGCKVYVDLFDKNFDYKHYLKQNRKIKHISLADKAGLIVIAPATANIIGKIANGIADDLLTATVMATNALVLICPSMNSKMWENEIVQENVKKLKRLGYYFIEPEYGTLACGYKGVGRLANLKKIKNEIISLINKKNQFKGKEILVTAGPTSEEIDAVRVITNKSSGKMGVYIAEEAAKRGANVTLIRGITNIKPSGNIKDVKINSASELYREIKKQIKNKDIMIHAAAVSDFKVENKKSIKIKSNKKINLKLKPTLKIIDNLKKIKKNIFLIGFKAEYGLSKKGLIKRAYDTLKSSNADLIVANDVKKNLFGSEKNEVFVVDKNKKVRELKLNEKRIIASQILDMI